MPKIKTKKGEYKYRTKSLYPGMKKIDRKIAKENLLLFQKILDANHLNFGLLYGTLLGAVREHDFIEHDEDIDLFILDEDHEKFLDLLFELDANGFRVIRYDQRGLISIMRKNEYIDIYFFSVLSSGVRCCSGLCVKEPFLLETTMFDFLGSRFLIPRDYIDYLNFEYGNDWMIPIAYTDFNVSGFHAFYYQLKDWLKSFLPDFIYFKIKKRREEMMIADFNNKNLEKN